MTYVINTNQTFVSWIEQPGNGEYLRSKHIQNASDSRFYLVYRQTNVASVAPKTGAVK